MKEKTLFVVKKIVIIKMIILIVFFFCNWTFSYCQFLPIF